jgi:hypothetical protein
MDSTTAQLVSTFQSMDDATKQRLLSVLDTPRKDGAPRALTQESGSEEEITMRDMGTDVVDTDKLQDLLQEYQAACAEITKLNAQVTEARGKKKESSAAMMELMSEDVVELDDFILRRDTQPKRAALSEKLIKTVLVEQLGDDQADEVLQAIESHRDANGKEETTLSIRKNTKKRKRT